MSHGDKLASLDTHFYDGKMEDTLRRYRARLSVIQDMPLDEKMRVIVPFVDNFIGKMSTCAQNNLRAIVNAAINVASSNYEGVNRLHAEDLLYLHAKKNSPDSIEMLKLAFEDMSTGMCPQGRCTRLFQVYYMLFDAEEEEELKRSTVERSNSAT